MKYLKGTFGLLISILIMGTGMDAFGFLGFSGTSWKEEVLLHDGGKIIVDRSVSRGGRHEIGQKPPYKEQRLSFVMPGSNRRVVWEDNFSEDLGMANFLPQLLDVHTGVAYLVVSPMGCLSYNKWGRPNPPYVVFKHVADVWQRIPLEGLPAEIKTPNLIFSAPDIAVEKSGELFMTAEKIRAIISKYPQPEYKTILREPVPPRSYGSSVNCEELIPFGKAGWLGLDWFKEQPSYETCVKFCEKKGVNPEHCPCDRIFGRK